MVQIEAQVNKLDADKALLNQQMAGHNTSNLRSLGQHQGANADRDGIQVKLDSVFKVVQRLYFEEAQVALCDNSIEASNVLCGVKAL